MQVLEGIWKDRENSLQPLPDHVGSAVNVILHYRKKRIYRIYNIHIIGYRVILSNAKDLRKY